jgi:hypothetical protein
VLSEFLFRRVLLFIPKRILGRPSVQVLCARLEVAFGQRQVRAGPKVPIFGEVTLGGAGWRLDVALLLWMLAQEASVASDRPVWLLCIGTPREEPLEELYALAVQAEQIVQLHIFEEPGIANSFKDRFVPQPSREEGLRRQVLGVQEAFAKIAGSPGVLDRATSARSAAHTFVKQWSMGRLAIAVDASQVNVAFEYCKQNGRGKGRFCFLVTGDPLRAANGGCEAGEIVFVRRLGLSFLDELGLIRACDAYIGACDHSAVLAADAGVPCLLSSNAAVHFGDRIRCETNLMEVSGAWIDALEHREKCLIAHGIDS